MCMAPAEADVQACGVPEGGTEADVPGSGQAVGVRG